MKNFVIEFVKKWIIAVCENFEEAIYARKKWAWWILLVKKRGSDLDDVFIMPNEDLIVDVLNEVQIPVFVRVKFWHFWEAKICEELWADWIIEAFQDEKSLEDRLNEEEFSIPVISEIFDIKKIQDSSKNVLILGDYATWNFSSISEKFKKIPKDFLEWKNIFLWWWISSVADLDVLKGIWDIHWFFVWSAIFDVEEKEFFEDFYRKN